MHLIGIVTKIIVQKLLLTNLTKYLFYNMSTIAFIFANRNTDQWSTPLAIVNEFQSRGWDTKIYSLFDDQDNYVDTNIYPLLNTKPNIIIHMDWGRHLSSILAKLKNTGAYCIMESGDDPQNFARNVHKAPYFDLILSPDIRAVNEYNKRGYHAIWWTHFADTNIYFPMPDIPEKYIALSSRGSGSSPILDALAQDSNFANINGWHGIEHAEFLNSAPIVVQHSRWGEITRRIFEAMACGKLVITDRLNKSTNIDSLFIENEDIVYYENFNDCVNKIDYYFKHKELRLKIAYNGKNKIIQHHTQKQRVDLIMELYTNQKKNKYV